MAEQLGMFGAEQASTLLEDCHAILERAHARQGVRPSYHQWYPGAPRVGTMPEHDAEWLADRFLSLLESLPERAAHHQAQRAAEARRTRVLGAPLVLRGAGRALRWWTPEKRFVPNLRDVTRRRLERWVRFESTYDRHGPCDGIKWGLSGALRRYTPWLCDDVWRALPQRLREATMREAKRLPPCVGELMHPVTIWWSLAPSHALRRLGLEAQ